MKKKFIASLLAASMLLTLAACGGKNEKPENSKTPADSTASTPATTPESSTGQEIQPEAAPSPESDSTPATPPENAITLYNGDYIVPSDDPYEVVTLPLGGKPLDKETLTVGISETFSDGNTYGPLEFTLGGETLFPGGVDANRDAIAGVFAWMYASDKEMAFEEANKQTIAPNSFDYVTFLQGAAIGLSNTSDQTVKSWEALPYYFGIGYIGTESDPHSLSFDGQDIKTLEDIVSVYGAPTSVSYMLHQLYYVWTFNKDFCIIVTSNETKTLVNTAFFRYGYMPADDDILVRNFKNELLVLADMGLYDAPVE